MRKSHRIGFGVLCLLTLFAAPFTSSAQVTKDTNPPVILSAVASCDDLTTIRVTFNEPVERVSATDIFNYDVLDSQGNSDSFIIAAFMVDSQTVLLRVFIPLVPGNSYTLDIVFCIPDLFGNCIELEAVPIEFETTPPEVTCSAAISTLFPPNNTLVNVGLMATTDSIGSLVQVKIYSDEPALTSQADATYRNGVLQLRARRNPTLDGRVYLIVVTSTDGCGNIGVCCTTVVVPKSGSAAALSSVQAQAAAAQSQCSPTGSPSTPHLILP